MAYSTKRRAMGPDTAVQHRGPTGRLTGDAGFTYDQEIGQAELAGFNVLKASRIFSGDQGYLALNAMPGAAVELQQGGTALWGIDTAGRLVAPNVPENDSGVPDTVWISDGNLVVSGYTPGGGGGSPGGSVEGAIQLRNADGSAFDASDTFRYNANGVELYETSKQALMLIQSDSTHALLRLYNNAGVGGGLSCWRSGEIGKPFTNSDVTLSSMLDYAAGTGCESMAYHHGDNKPIYFGANKLLTFTIYNGQCIAGNGISSATPQNGVLKATDGTTGADGADLILSGGAGDGVGVDGDVLVDRRLVVNTSMSDPAALAVNGPGSPTKNLAEFVTDGTQCNISLRGSSISNMGFVISHLASGEAYLQCYDGSLSYNEFNFLGSAISLMTTDQAFQERVEGIRLASGNVVMPNLPTSDPAIAGALWNDAGTVKISAG